MAAFLGPILQGLAGAGAGAFLGSGGGTSTKDTTPAFQTQLIDQLMQGLQGQGPFASLFSGDQAAFQQSVADPLMQQFRTQTAPGIQQSFIASGQQRGTPVESALARAGLDVQGQINQQFLPFQQGAQNRASSALGQLLGFKPQQQTSLTPLGGAVAGLASSGSVQDIIKMITGGSGGSQGSSNPLQGLTGNVTQFPQRKGFE